MERTAIVLLYCPRLVRPLIYAHLGLVYSLLIATTLSVCFGLLTKNDEIFVLVIVASPASVALWCLTLSRRFPLPSPPSDTDSTKKHDWEHRALQGAAAGALVFELVMVFVTMSPKSWRVFRQPACALTGGRVANALWAACYLEGGAWVLLGYVMWELVCRGREDTGGSGTRKEKGTEKGEDAALERGEHEEKKEAYSEWERWRSAAEPDIITWTEVSLAEQFPSTSASTTKAAIILVLQCVALPDVGRVSYQNVPVLAILLAGLVADVLRARVVNGRSLLYVLLEMLVALAVVPCVLGTVLHFGFPTSADLVLAYVCIVVTWRRFNAPDVRRRQVFLRRFLFILWVFVALAGSAFAWVLYLDTYTRESIAAAQGTRKSFANLFTLPVWLLAWLSTAVSPGRRMPQQDKVKGCWWLAPLRFGKKVAVRLLENVSLSCVAVASRAHILKVGLLIVTPNVIWIQMSIASDISDSPNWTFGQLFAMLVSLVSIVSLADAAVNVNKDVWWAVLCSRRIPKRRGGSHSLGVGVDSEPLNARRPPLAVQRYALMRS
ncbi:hypothetical protein DXG01_007441 [Tephrocybe rancida]|nr:hypothetical protein DXG01_007441 [Tephrocybe rancida]